MYSIPEGSVVFPKVPLMRVEGPVAVSSKPSPVVRLVYVCHTLFWALTEIWKCLYGNLHLLWHHQVVQLLETPFVNLINYASLVTTNAARHRHVAGKSKVLLEFGLRRAQVWYYYPPLFNCHCNTFFYRLIFSCAYITAGTRWCNKCLKILFYGRFWCHQVGSFHF